MGWGCNQIRKVIYFSFNQNGSGAAGNGEVRKDTYRQPTQCPEKKKRLHKEM